jgi:hypothetical protein
MYFNTVAIREEAEDTVALDTAIAKSSVSTGLCLEVI